MVNTCVTGTVRGITMIALSVASSASFRVAIAMEYAPASSREVGVTEPECSIAQSKSPVARRKLGRYTPLMVEALEESIMKDKLVLA
jgi:hypothetical protein